MDLIHEFKNAVVNYKDFNPGSLLFVAVKVKVVMIKCVLGIFYSEYMKLM